MLADERNFVDLFYFDGACRYSSWFRLAHIDEYVKRLPQLSTLLAPHMPEPSTAEPISGSPDVTRISVGGDCRFINFGNISERKVVPASITHRITERESKDHVALNVGLIGGGRWPLGMIVRQMDRSPDVSLRGVCDRRPEIASLAAKCRIA